MRPLLLAEGTYPPPHPRAGQELVVNAFAIRHADGVFLFDTGPGSHEAVDRFYQLRRRAIAEALRDAGLDTAAVVGIASSHLHFDHCGQNAAFAGTPVHVQRAERDAASRPGYTIPEWVDFPGARYILLDGDAEPLTGIRLLATPGHTAGHQSAAVDTDDGLVVLAGHAVFSREEWIGAAAAEEDDAVSRASAERLRDLFPRRVHFSHDRAVWEREAA